jgi:HK97 family phage major capsid protein
VTAASTMTIDTGTGGELVRTDLMTDQFIAYLANRLVIRAAGARVLEGLVGNVDIPKKTAPASVGWVAEDGSTTATGFTTGSVQVRPKTVNGATTISRLMQLQTSRGIEALVRDDLLSVVLGAIDLGALHGTGQSNQPKGLINQDDVGLVEIDTTGGFPMWIHILDLEREVAIDNADFGALAYITNPKVRSRLKGTPKESGQPIYVWEAGPTPLNGYPAFVTSNVASNLTKSTGSNLSAIFFGNWQDMLIGLWGGLDVIANPFNADGSISVYVFQTCDVQVRHGESFAVIKDAKTS